jgi:hypothetical protein
MGRTGRGRNAVARAASLGGAGLLALMPAGCGTAADRQQAGRVAERFYEAARAGDGAAACAQLSAPTAAQLVKDEHVARCEQGVSKLTLHGGRIAVARVYATSAAVQLAGGDTVFLGAGARGWRIDALGCRPNGDGTYDCEEQA